MSESMRGLINIVESRKSLEVDEGVFDYIKKVAPILDPVARARKHGQKEVSDLTKRALAKFAKYMGRLNQDFASVTWNTLFKYLTMQDQLAIEPADAKKLILDPGTKASVNKILSGANLPLPDPKTWGKPGVPISGDPANIQSNDVGLAVITYIMELAAIKNLEKAAGGEDMPNQS